MNKLIALAALLAASTTACTDDLVGADVAADDVSVFAPGHRAANGEEGVTEQAISEQTTTGLPTGTIGCPPAPKQTEADRTGAVHTDATDAAAATDTAVAKAAVAQAAASDAPADRELPDDFCEHLPADGACSLACDPEKLVEQYVPAGSCVLIVCTLDTGETFKTGGCHLAD